MSGHYTGLSSTAKIWIIGLSALVAIINLSIAWNIANSALKEIPISESDVEEIVALSRDVGDPIVYANNIQLRTHAINTQVHLKGITNKQSIIIVAIGGSFALMAIGFALFLIGADGAFSIQAENANSKLVFSATAPGLMCFFLAALLIALAITRNHELNIGSSQYVTALPGSSQRAATTQPPTIDP